MTDDVHALIEGVCHRCTRLMLNGAVLQILCLEKEISELKAVLGRCDPLSRMAAEKLAFVHGGIK